MSDSIYLSGPMTGYENNNKDEFDRVTKILKDMGYKVWSPAENEPSNETREVYMRMDFEALLTECDRVVVLDKWEESWGAILEVTVAREVGLPIYKLEENDSPELVPEKYWPPAILAQKFVSMDRNKDYGHPLDDYQRTSDIWNGMLGLDTTAKEAMLCMIGVKCSREAHKHKYDNCVDIAGYAACIEKAYREEQRRKKSESNG